MDDQVFVCVGSVVLCNSIETGEEISCFNSNEPVYTDIADIYRIAIQLILYVTMLFDLLPARAMIELFADFNPNQPPFGPCDVKVL
jgi:hypothetical protein